jgi:basic amino acid/polyamine antiporter, APA family
MANFFLKKPLSQLLGEAAAQGEGTLKRTLGAWNLLALGIGAIIGAGLFVRTASAAASSAGSAVTISFIVAAIGCAFAGLCYAEFAAMIPIAGSAYTYAYTTMGELAAWVIGWALIMEYALGAATVSIAWSEYLNKLLGGAIPYQWCHSPFQEQVINQVGTGVHGIMNLPALLILGLLTAVLIKGTEESAVVNAVIVFIKVAIVLVFIAVGFGFINEANHTPYMIPENAVGHSGIFKHGYGGILGGAAIVFFAFIGFDAVSTAAQEAKNPGKDMPIGILGSLAVCTVLYILFAHVLTGVAPWADFADPEKGKEASVAYAISTYMTGYGWLATAVTVAILAGFSSVILVMLMGQSRVFFTMSKDGLMPPVFGKVHPKFSTPYMSNIIVFCFVSLFAGFIPGDVAGDLTSFGTLLAFVIVCIGIPIMRKSDPNANRPFRAPLVPLVPILGVVVCLGMIVALDVVTLVSAVIWMVVGLIVYFIYGQKNSKLQSEKRF